MYRLIVYIIMKCKNKWIWNMFKWTFYFYFHLLPLDKWDLCKTGTLNVHSWAIKIIVNRRFWINYIMMKKKKTKKPQKHCNIAMIGMIWSKYTEPYMALTISFGWNWLHWHRQIQEVTDWNFLGNSAGHRKDYIHFL